MATLGYISDWSTRLASRLYTQFRGKITWGQWVDLLSGLAQDWEDAAQTLLTLLDIDASVGLQLDVIGRFVGQARSGLDDATYRLYLRTRVLSNRSTGTAEDVYAVVITLLGSDTAPLYIGGVVKQFAVRIGKVITRAQAIAAASFLGSAKESATRAILEWQEYDSGLMFTFDNGAGSTDAARGFGDSTDSSIGGYYEGAATGA